MTNTRIFSEANGDEFEANVIDAIKSNLRKKGQLDRLVVHTGDRLDRYQGTDFEIDGIRVDATCAFSEKDHMAKTNFEPIYTQYGDLQFGIRLGNNYKGFTSFEKPVVVVGMDLDNVYAKVWADAIGEAITKMAPMIISYIKECYEEFMNA